MIKGKKKQDASLKVEDVLSRIDEFSIFRYYLGVDFRIGKPFCNPFRTDRNPSCTINQLNNGLQMMDWASLSWRGDCIDIVRKAYSLTLQEALQKINDDFGLGLGSGEKYHIRKAPIYKVPKLEDMKKTSLIQFKGRRPHKFNSLERDYWNSYHVSFDILERENVFGVSSLYIDREKFPLPKGEPVFAYYEESIQKCKIYRPFANKEKKEWKWRSTIPFSHMHGLHNMQECENIVIFKSNKDRIIGLHFLEQALSVQGESFAAISEENLERIKSLSHRQYIGFGSDPQGKEQSLVITEQLGMLHINTPDEFLQEGINDFAELAKQYSIKRVQQHFIEKDVIQLLKTA
jgi:hypothetical protein